jgi:hypothetical protein
MHTTRTLFAAALAAASLIAGTGGPASGGAFECDGTITTAPDARAKEVPQPYVGKGVYPFQTISRDALDPSEQTAFKLRWKNVSGLARKIKVALDVIGEQPDGYSVRYFVQGVNVNDQIKARGKIPFRGVEPDTSTPTLVLVVKNKTNIDPLAFVLHNLWGRYGGSAPTDCDLVRIAINA